MGWFQSLLLAIILFLSFVNSRPQDDIDSIFEEQKECSVNDQSGQTKPCHFPFIFENQTYYGCTLKGAPEGGNHWCSTKQNQLTQEHVSGGGHFGDCLEDACPSAEVAEEVHNTLIETTRDSHNVYETRSGGFPFESSGPSCDCETFTSCRWSKNLADQATKLSRTHPTRKSLIKMIKSRLCPGSKSSVYCCNGENPTDSELRELKNPKTKATTKSPNSTPLRQATKGSQDSGKWKPSGAKEECGKRISISNIVGGSITKLGDYPYMALIGSKNFDGKVRYGCGGSLINKWYVLTASHCIADSRGNLKAKPEEILLGEHKISTDPDCPQKKGAFRRGKNDCFAKVIKRKVDKVIKHEDYDPKLVKNDIALIRLDEPVPLFKDDPKGSPAMPICLPWDDNLVARDLYEGDEVLVSGWGRVTNDKKEGQEIFRNVRAGSDVLKKVTVPLFSETACKRYGLDLDKQLCAGGKQGQDSCTGDSGGPLVFREFSSDPWYQVGVVSFGYGEQCGSEFPGVYTKVGGYLDWIESHLED